MKTDLVDTNAQCCKYESHRHEDGREEREPIQMHAQTIQAQTKTHRPSMRLRISRGGERAGENDRADSSRNWPSLKGSHPLSVEPKLSLCDRYAALSLLQRANESSEREGRESPIIVVVLWLAKKCCCVMCCVCCGATGAINLRCCAGGLSLLSTNMAIE